MYSVFNKKWNYVYLFTNRVASHTQRKFYIELHRDEFTDNEYYTLENTTLFNKNILYKFPTYDIVDGADPKIFLSRNPYSRCLSSYSLYLSTNDYLSENIKKQSKDFYNKNPDHNFLKFVKYLNEEVIFDTHVLPQSINYEKYTNNITLGKIDKPEDTLYNFYSKLGFDMNFFKETYAKVFSKKLNKSISDIKIESLLTDEVENLIYKFYKKDFELFGYSRYEFNDSFSYLL